jgi:2'-5' RNA ligase
VPAHVTLLYPFVAPAQLDRSVRSLIEAVAGRHAPFSYSLAGRATWPDTIYVSVDPVEPFIALQGDLARAFPDYPIYGQTATFEFVPHVTVAEGAAGRDPSTLDSAAWGSLPRLARASALEVISRVGNAPWRTVWRIDLRGHPGSAAR